MKLLGILLFSLWALMILSSPIFAAESQEGITNVITSVPRAMSFQGILKDSGGDPVADSVYDVTFRIYDAESGGTSEWSEVLPCTTSAGYFTALFDNVNIPFDEDYWVELEVDGEILTPRQKITMVGYSARSDTSDYAVAGGGWVDDGLNVHLEASYDKVGIGTSTPTNKLHVTGSESVPILNVEQYGSHRAARFYSQNACALWVEHAGNHGLRVTEADGDGVYIHNAGVDGIHVDSAGGWAGYFGGKGYFEDSVGIGTSSPTELLDIAGTAKMNGFNMPPGASDGYVLTSDVSGNGTWQAAAGSSDSDWVISGNNQYSGVSGNVGIGTPAPIEKLQVAGTVRMDGFQMPGGASNGYVLTSDGAGNGAWQAAAGGSDSDWVISDTNMYSGVSGNIGIGTSSPSEKLEVSGNLKIGGKATIGPGHTNSGSGSTIAGGGSNTTAGGASFIGAGQLNNANGSLSVIGGGLSNDANGFYSVVGGGDNNTASGDNAAIAGGLNNSTSNNSCFVGAGMGNSATGDASAIAGGYYNSTSNNYSAVGGGSNNKALGQSSFIGGGFNNVAEASWSAILGGQGDTITSAATRSYLFGFGSKLTQPSTFMVDMPHIRFGTESTGYEFPTSDGSANQVMVTDGSGQLNWASSPAGNWTVTDSVLYTNSYWGISRGGVGNVLTGDSVCTVVNMGVACTTFTSLNSYYPTISGGYGNRCSGDYSTIGGGYQNRGISVYGSYTISGGYQNEIGGAGQYASVGGGYKNHAQGGKSVISGGGENYASGYASTICGGLTNRNLGRYSSIVGGESDTLENYVDYSMAFGKGVYVNNSYRVAFFDSVNQGKLMLNCDSRNLNIFNSVIQAGAPGGSGGGGAYLSTGGTWTNGSSRSFKDNFAAYHRDDLFRKISSMPLEFWEYRNSDERHIGPMAEDFSAAFDVGIIRETDGQRENRYLAASDVAGVALAGVKELIQLVNELKEENQELKSRIEELETKVK